MTKRGHIKSFGFQRIRAKVTGFQEEWESPTGTKLSMDHPQVYRETHKNHYIYTYQSGGILRLHQEPSLQRTRAR